MVGGCVLITDDVRARFSAYLDRIEYRCLVDAGDRGLEFVEVVVDDVKPRFYEKEGMQYGFWCEGSSGCAEYF